MQMSSGVKMSTVLYVSFVTPLLSFEAVNCLNCGRRRVAVTGYGMTCLLLLYIFLLSVQKRKADPKRHHIPIYGKGMDTKIQQNTSYQDALQRYFKPKGHVEGSDMYIYVGTQTIRPCQMDNRKTYGMLMMIN